MDLKTQLTNQVKQDNQLNIQQFNDCNDKQKQLETRLPKYLEPNLSKSDQFRTNLKSDLVDLQQKYQHLEVSWVNLKSATEVSTS